MRLPSLCSESISFTFKLINRILPCESRLSRILPGSSSHCKFHCPDSDGNLEHIFFYCKLSECVGNWLLNVVKSHDEDATTTSILSLDLTICEGLIWIIIQTLFFIWTKRTKNKRADLQECLANLSDTTQILSGTRHEMIASSITQILLL